MTAIGAVLLAAACAYDGSFAMRGAGPFPPERVQLGCVDLGVGAHAASRRVAPVVSLAFGNRCSHRVALDLGTLRAQGRTADGTVVELQPVGRAQRFGVVELGARWMAREEIEFELADRSERLLNEVCVDVGGLARAPDPEERWLCVDPSTPGGRS